MLNQSVLIAKPTLSIEERRAVVYATLIRTAPEPAYLRERALDQIVLAGLIGSTKSEPLKIGKIEMNLYHSQAPFQVRVEIIKPSLLRLQDKGYVDSVEERKKTLYYLSDKGCQALEEMVNKGEEDLFVPVLKRLLRNIEAVIDYETASIIVRRYIFECFARAGREIARCVLDLSDTNQLPELNDIKDAFDVAIESHLLSSEAIESLRYRCHKFLKSSDPIDKRLKYQLTQGYYLVELLGAHSNSFDPLVEQTFRGSVFYLDTNVVIAGILFVNERSILFKEIVTLAKKLGIELKVTSETLNEATTVIERKSRELIQFFQRVPSKLHELAKDDFLDAYLISKSVNSEMTIDEFLLSFADLRSVLAEWGIGIDSELAVTSYADCNNLQEYQEIIQRATLAKNKGKSEAVLQHDSLHFVYIEEKRAENSQTWFLTQDRSIVDAANEICERHGNTNKPICYFMLAFLQSISPFVSTPDEAQTLADVFSSMLASQILPTDGLFEVRELLMIAEMHDDVLATPNEELIPALDHIKKNVLGGRSYEREEMTKVASELKQFLSKTKDERERALRHEIEGLQQQLKVQQQTHLNEQSRFATELDKTKQEGIDKIEALRREFQQGFGRATASQWRDRAIGGMILGIIIWLFRGEINTYWSESFVHWKNLNVNLIIINLIGLLIFVIPTLYWFQQEVWSKETKIVICTVFLIAALAMSHVFNDDALGTVASFIEVAVLITTVIFQFVDIKQLKILSKLH